MKLMKDYMLVKREEYKRDTSILIPQNIEDDLTRGKVFNVGPGLRNADGKEIPVVVKIGDIILFATSIIEDCPTVREDGQEYLIIPERQVWAIEN